MTVFGDYDPDDAYDAGDPVVQQLQHIARRIAWLVEHRDDLEDRVQRIVDDIAAIRQRVLDGNL